MITALRGVAITALVALAVAGSAGCSSEGFCLDCDDAAVNVGDGGDGGSGDGGLPSDAGPADASGDAGPPPDACVVGGSEICDGLDNDCNGQADDGVLPGEGDDCNAGLSPPCTTGTTECVGGALVCGGGAINPEPEQCDGDDNDCDGVADDGNPEGNQTCGDATGECATGITMCNQGTGTLDCINQVGPTDEICNGRDDDCDGTVDDETGGGDCGPATETGSCQFGTNTCVGGQIQCVGAIYPQLEDCDLAMTSDLDCVGGAINGFDLSSDIRHCGACGDACPAVADAFEACVDSGCVIAACATDYWDNNGAYADGCEFGPCEFQGAEDCNGVDDDCDGLTDLEDPTLEAPACATAGECAGTVAVCTPTGWSCDYPDSVSTDVDGNIVPETQCDGLDNDCDGDEDEAFPLLTLGCDDGQDGSCRDSGVYVCNPAGTGVECTADDDDGGVGGAESCNGVDDNCDGAVDEGDLNVWVDVGGGVEIFAYEASRQDADAASQGSMENRPCSKADALPWTNVTHDEAEAACAAVGGSLCSETEWEDACETTQTFEPAGLIEREAEAFTTTFSPCPTNDAWTAASTVTGFSGTGYMALLPDDGDRRRNFTGGGDCSNSDNAANFGAQLNYTVNLPTTGTWYLWVNGTSPGGNGNSIHIGFDGFAVFEDVGDFATGTSWTWIGSDFNSTANRITLDVAATGNHTLTLLQREDGVRLDRFVLTQDVSYDPAAPPRGCTWAFEGDCETFVDDTCNGNDYDADLVAAGDQDALLPTGELAACFADWGAAGEVHDLSGNVKEWTAERSAGVNPIRGGAYNNTATGISCRFDFLTADDAFLFDNVGFRCCR